MTADLRSQYRALTELASRVPEVKTFGWNLLIGNNEDAVASEVIDIPVESGNKGIVPFVKSGSPGKIVGGYVKSLETVKAPRIRIKTEITAEERNRTRDLTSNVIYVGNGGTPVDPAEKMLTDKARYLKNLTQMTKEYLVMQIAQTGAFSLTDPDTGFTASIDYGVPAQTNRPTLQGNYVWGGTSSDVYGNLCTYRDLVTDAVPMSSGVRVILGASAYQKFIKDATILKLLDTKSLNPGTLALNGSNYVGSLDGMEIYRYKQTCKAVDGTTDLSVMGAYSVIVVPITDIFTCKYGMVQELEASIVAKEFFKTYKQEDPSTLWALMESRPVPILRYPSGIVCATVGA